MNNDDKQYQVLRRSGLKEGHAIYDLACGSGRTASALQRHGWTGAYAGADIIPKLVEYATQKNPGFQFFVHPDNSIRADDNSQGMIFVWSLFTHLQLEEIFLYSKDCLRALKSGSTFIFSFLTFKDHLHREHFLSRARTQHCHAGSSCGGGCDANSLQIQWFSAFCPPVQTVKSATLLTQSKQ